MRVKETYGGSAISGITSSHHNWGIVGYKMGPFARFMNMMEFTPVLDNPDSWEGWHWGASHTYGFFWRLGMPEPYDMLSDALQNAEMIVYWSNDPDTTRGTYSGQDSALWRQWLKEKGVKMVFIDPFYNYTNAVMGGKWIAPRLGTDTAVAMAIAFVWITEDTYNKDYVADRTIGFDEFKPYVMGETDGVPKTPEWAEPRSRASRRATIRTLAREWAAKRTILSGGSRGGEGGACRTAYGTEWARMMVLLQAMQGLGAPGRSIWGTTMGAPTDTTVWFPGYGEPEGRMSMSTKVAKYIPQNPTKQRLWRLTVPEAILDGHIEWYGDGFCGKSLEQQFMHLQVPDGGLLRDQAVVPLRRLLHRHHERHQQLGAHVPEPQAGVRGQPGHLVAERDPHGRRHPAGLHQLRARRHRRVGGHQRLHRGTPRAAATTAYIVREQKCIEPLWESKSDYEIFALVAEKMGLRDEYTDGGKTDVDWVKALLRHLRPAQGGQLGGVQPQGLPHRQHQRRLQAHPGLRWFYEGRPCDTPDLGNPKRLTERRGELGTFSGKIEFESVSLKQYFPDDEERPVVPRYIPSWEGHHTTELFEKYPLALMSPHPRYVVPLPLRQAHRLAQRHPGAPHQEGRLRLVAGPHQPGGRRQAGHQQQRHRPALQRPRLGALHRGGHRAGAPGRHPQLRLVGPSTIRCSRAIPTSIDRGGCVSILTPARMMSKNVPGMTPNSCLIEIEKWEG